MLGLFRTKDIQLKNRSEFEKILARIYETLRNNAFSGQADVVRQLLTFLIQEDNQKFLKLLTGIDMWGGSGGVWEVGGFATDNDEKEFWNLVIMLTDEMKSCGIKCRAAYSVADMFRKELKKVQEK